MEHGIRRILGVTGYDAVAEAARTGTLRAPVRTGGCRRRRLPGRWHPRPEGQPPLGIGEVDGPYHLGLRRALSPFFSTGAIERMRPFMQQSVNWFLDQKIADGAMDLVLDYASPVPAILTMKLMGLPYDNWRLYANLFHSVIDAPDADAYTRRSRKSPR